MEWVALGLVVGLYLRLKNMESHVWDILEPVLQRQRRDTRFFVAWAPHKMKYDGTSMVSSADGANDRADYYLFARYANRDEWVELCSAYHTTHFM